MEILTKTLSLLLLVKFAVNLELVPGPMNKVTVEKVLCAKQPGSKVDHFNCRVKYIDRNHLKVEAWANLTEPLSSIKTRGLFYYKYNTYQRVGGEVRLDICDWLKGTSNYILDWFLAKIQRYTNLNHKCPYDGFVYFKVENISVDEFASLKLMPAGRYRIDTIAMETDAQILLNFSIFFSISDYRTNVDYSKL